MGRLLEIDEKKEIQSTVFNPRKLNILTIKGILSYPYEKKISLDFFQQIHSKYDKY